VVAILAGAWLAMREARHRGERTDIILDALIVIAVAALIGGRAYNVIDQWSTGPDYKDHLLQIILPPYSGLGIYGGLFTGLLATIWLARHYKVSFWRWADIMAPCILLAQVVGRWGNFANQELYGPPTTLPWGIAIQCQYRVAQYACPAGSDPTATLGQHFIPLFFYESMLSLLGVLVMLWLWNHFTAAAGSSSRATWACSTSSGTAWSGACSSYFGWAGTGPSSASRWRRSWAWGPRPLPSWRS